MAIDPRYPAYFEDLSPGTLFRCPKRPGLQARVVFAKLNTEHSVHANAMRMMPMCRERERIPMFESVAPITDEAEIAEVLRNARRRLGKRRKTPAKSNE